MSRMISGQRLLVACLVALLVCSFSKAQQSPSAQLAVVPRLVNFSGRAVDSQGKAISGTAGVTFAIYKDQYEGSPLWLETHNVQADAKGNYTAQLGATKPAGLPLDLFTSGEARWLGVTINGGQEQPRVLLLSVPYALKAADAETIGGLPPSAFVRADPEDAHPGAPSGASTSVSSPAPASAKTATPAILLAVKTSSPGATVGFVPLWTGTKSPTTQIGSSALFQKGTNIGIGTVKPAASLDVFASNAGIHAPMAQFGSSGKGDCNSIRTYTGSGSTEIFQAQTGCFVPGAVAGDGGMRVNPGNKIILGDSGKARLTLDSIGNAAQPAAAWGFVKAAALVNAFELPFNIMKCFNSSLSGAAATTPPCGINFTEDSQGAGYWDFDFGFEVDNRFFSATITYVNKVGSAASCIGAFPISANTVEVSTSDCNSNPKDTFFYLIVY